MADALVEIIHGVALGPNGLEPAQYGGQAGYIRTAETVGRSTGGWMNGAWQVIAGPPPTDARITPDNIDATAVRQFENLKNAPKLKEAIGRIADQLVACRRADRKIAYDRDVPEAARRFKELAGSFRAAEARLEVASEDELSSGVREVLSGSFGPAVAQAARTLPVPLGAANSSRAHFIESNIRDPARRQKYQEANRVISRVRAIAAWSREFDEALEEIQGPARNHNLDTEDAQVRAGVLGLIMHPRNKVTDADPRCAFVHSWGSIKDLVEGPLRRTYTAAEVAGFVALIERGFAHGLEAWAAGRVRSGWEAKVQDMMALVKEVRIHLAGAASNSGGVETGAAAIGVLAAKHAGCERDRPDSLAKLVNEQVHRLGIREQSQPRSAQGSAAPPSFASAGVSMGPWGSLSNVWGAREAPHPAQQLLYTSMGMNSGDLMFRSEMHGPQNALLGLTSRDPYFGSEGYRIGPTSTRSPLTPKEFQYGSAGLSAGLGGGLGIGLQSIGYPNMVPDFMNELPRANGEYANPGKGMYSGDYLRAYERPMEAMGMYGSLVNMGHFGERGNVFGEESESDSSSESATSSESEGERRRRKKREARKKKKKEAKSKSKSGSGSGVRVGGGIVMGGAKV